MIPLSAFSQKSLPESFCISKDEKVLFDAVNDLRVAYGESLLQHSASLSHVGKLHVDDLLEMHPDTSVCNLSSWSDKGDWTACCYNSYIPNPECMWSKPKELTPYTYRGYEMVMYFEDKISVDSIIKLWSDSKEMLDMLLTRANFQEKKWICMGMGINEHYVSIWFGQRRDRLPSPSQCTAADTSTIIPVITKNENISERPVYYLIFGSFDNIKDAREALKRIKKGGYEEAGILAKNGRFRLYLLHFDTLKEAMFAKQGLPYTYNEAWILKD